MASHAAQVEARSAFANSGQKPRVLIVEDNSWLALMMSEDVAELGCIIVGPAQTLSEALGLARNEALDAALVDVGLGVENSFPVAQVLTDRRIPFAFITGRGDPPDLPFEKARVLHKPFGTAALQRAVTEILDISAA